jgi:hypothetical protein
MAGGGGGRLLNNVEWQRAQQALECRVVAELGPGKPLDPMVKPIPGEAA